MPGFSVTFAMFKVFVDNDKLGGFLYDDETDDESDLLSIHLDDKSRHLSERNAPCCRENHGKEETWSL